MAHVQSATTDGEYEIRRYRSRDRSKFLSLYEDVWGRQKGREWFDWRFSDNPYSDRIEMVVAERAGTLVGAEPLLPFPLAAGAETVTARQPVDWIVHPEHRRRGLFTRMTERLLSTAADRASVLFNFPSEPLRPGLQKFDWVELGGLQTRYRVQNPARVVPDERGVSTAAAAIARVGTPALEACLAAADRLASPPESVTVARSEGVATDAVRTVYEETRPDGIHVPRETAFLEWRFANPRWETATYVARRDGEPTATVVVGTERLGDTTVARVLDVQPMRTDLDRAPAFAAALGALVRDHARADVIEAPANPFPRVFRRHCFLSDGAAPFARFSTPTTHAVRPLSATVDDALGRDVLDPDDWLLLLGDRDVA
jgi:GNAT superfamily N-acetyltransferase